MLCSALSALCLELLPGQRGERTDLPCNYKAVRADVPFVAFLEPNIFEATRRGCCRYGTGDDCIAICKGGAPRAPAHLQHIVPEQNYAPKMQACRALRCQARVYTQPFSACLKSASGQRMEKAERTLL
jgi:hypothetical protein